MTSDGKYCTLALFKQYVMGTRTDPNNPSVFQGAVVGTPDDNLLTDCILQAEAGFEMVTGSGFDQQTLSSVQSYLTFIDAMGWLHLFARERGPVTAVSAVQIRNLMAGDRSWKTVSWVADDIILPPYAAADTHPHPESWHVMIYSTSGMLPTASGQIMARWSYTGGYAANAVPMALSLLIARYSMWIYKMREAPLGRVTNLPLGSITVPMDVPPEIRRQMALWSPVYA